MSTSIDFKPQLWIDSMVVDYHSFQLSLILNTSYGQQDLFAYNTHLILLLTSGFNIRPLT